MEGTKLYVGGLPYSTNEDELEQLFSAYGAVESVRVIRDKFTGRSRGFGFVEMASPAEAEAAVEALNGYQLGGRSLSVNEAKPERDRGPRPGGGGGRFR